MLYLRQTYIHLRNGRPLLHDIRYAASPKIKTKVVATKSFRAELDQRACHCIHRCYLAYSMNFLNDGYHTNEWEEDQRERRKYALELEFSIVATKLQFAVQLDEIRCILSYHAIRSYHAIWSYHAITYTLILYDYIECKKFRWELYFGGFVAPKFLLTEILSH